jgi:hypothetical protein
MKTFFLTAFLMFFVIPVLPGQTEAPVKKRYTATRIAESPVIDGILNEELWKSGEWIDDFTQFEPYNGKPASQRTEFNIHFDDNNLYVGIRAFDSSPDSIVPRLTRRDEVDGDLVAI